MSLKILKVFDGGTLSSECVTLTVERDTNLESYAIADNTYMEGNPSNLHRHFYRFPSKNVKKYDIIRLYTGFSKPVNESHLIEFNQLLNKDQQIHRFYMGLRTAIWNDGGDYAFLYKVELIDKKKVND